MKTSEAARNEMYVTGATTVLLAAAAFGVWAWYSPPARPQIPLHGWLAAQPEVAEVEHVTVGPEPRPVVVHVRDWHLLPRELFAADVRSASKRALTDAEVEQLYREHLDAVERVQCEHGPLLGRLVEYALAYYRDFVRPAKRFRQPDATERAALADLAAVLRALPADATGEAIQDALYAVGKRHPFPELRAWFGCLYQVLLGQQEGPRFGQFIALYGIAETVALIEHALSRPADAA